MLMNTSYLASENNLENTAHWNQATVYVLLWKRLVFFVFICWANTDSNLFSKTNTVPNNLSVLKSRIEYLYCPLNAELCQILKNWNYSQILEFFLCQNFSFARNSPRLLTKLSLKLVE